MSNVLSENWQFSTLSIEDDLGEKVGTGFLVADTPAIVDKYGASRVTWNSYSSRAYLITARHVLGNNASEIECTTFYGLRYNAICETGLESQMSKFYLTNDPPNWVLHPNPNIDVAALDVTAWIASLSDAYFRFCPISELANPVSLMETDCDAGDDVFVVGYPLRLKQGRSNLPLIRKGVLASSPRRPLYEDDGAPLRGFLVDGAVMQGSSGSPVISASTRFHSGDMAMTPSRTLLVGLITQEWGRGNLSRYNTGRSTKIEASIPVEGYANLGFAHTSGAIIETILQFGHFSVQDFLKLDHDDNWAPQLGIPEWSLEYYGKQVDAKTAQSIMLRLHRDRMRSKGHKVSKDPFYDALEEMGPLLVQDDDVDDSDSD